MLKVVEIIRGRKSHSHQLLKLDFHPLLSFIVAEASFQLDIHEEKKSMFKAQRSTITFLHVSSSTRASKRCDCQKTNDFLFLADKEPPE